VQTATSVFLAGDQVMEVGKAISSAMAGAMVWLIAAIRDKEKAVEAARVVAITKATEGNFD